MPVTEADRHRLYESLKSTLGQTEAETFMNLMPPNDWNEIATKSDLALLRSDVVELRAELKTDFAELKTDFADLRAEMKTDIGELRADLLRTMGTWLFASQAGVIAAVAVLVAFLG